MNAFGVPANEHEMSMMKPHEKVMAESGVESNIWQIAASVGIGLFRVTWLTYFITVRL